MGEEPLQKDTDCPDVPSDRREFIKGAACIIGGVAGLVPMAAGLRVVLAPLGSETTNGGSKFFRVGHVSELVLGLPRKYTIFADKADKWSLSKNVPIGAVYVLMVDGSKGAAHPKSQSVDPAVGNGNNPAAPMGPSPAPANPEPARIIAFNTVCPHLGCFVDFRNQHKDFFCPCHNSNFDITGRLVAGVSPRSMDTLRAEIRNGDEIWVEYQRFQANTAQKIPL